MATTRKVIALADNGLQELVDENAVGIPGTGANSEVHNSTTPGLATATGSFSANQSQVDGQWAFGANEGQAPGLKAFAANYSVAGGSGAFSANGGRAPGDQSAAFGSGNVAHSRQLVCGMYATDDLSGDVGEPSESTALFKVGNGTTTDAPDRADAFRIYRDGTAYHAKRISYGIWNGYAEGPVDFVGGAPGPTDIPVGGSQVLGYAPALKGSLTIPNDLANMAPGDVFKMEWIGRVYQSTGSNLYFRDVSTASYTQPMYITGLANGDYYTVLTATYKVVQILSDVPQMKHDFSIEMWTGDGYTTPMTNVKSHRYALQLTGGGSLFPASVPLLFQLGISTDATTKPKQISFRMWRE